MKMAARKKRFIFLDNVKEHATLSAGASVDHGVDVETTLEHENRAADRGCCVSTCCASDSWFAIVKPSLKVSRATWKRNQSIQEGGSQ
jgi:hypothetical protein